MSKQASNIILISLIVVFFLIVGLVAFLFWQIPEKITSDEIITGGLTGWKTYRNEEYGFEIKYPGSWYNYEDDMGNIIISTYSKDIFYKAEECEDLGENSAEIILWRRGGSMERELEVIKLYYEKIMNGVITAVKIDEPVIEEITIEGENSYRIYLNYYEQNIMCKEGIVIIYLFADKNNERFFHFWGDFRGKNREVYEKYAETFDQMLSTFKFLE